MKKLKFSPAQIQFLAQINAQKQQAPENVQFVEEQADVSPPKQNLIS